MTHEKKAQDVKTLSRNSRLWVWSAVILSLLTCTAISLIYFKQQQILKQSLEVAENNSQAQIDLSKGFLHIGLANNPQLPFNREEGLAFIKQAETSFLTNIAILEKTDTGNAIQLEIDKSLIASFQKNLSSFQETLHQWMTNEKRDPAIETILRIKFFKLEQQADLIDSILRKELETLTQRFDLTFYITLIASAIFLAGVCLIVFSVVTRQEKTNKALLESESLYRSLFENMFNGLATHQIISENGKPVDFLYLNTNSAFNQITGLKNVIGKTMNELIPDFPNQEPELYGLFSRVATTGLSEKAEIYIKTLGIWLSVSAYMPRPGHLISVLESINERKRFEEDLLKKNTEYLALNEEYLALNEELQKNFDHLNKMNAQLKEAKNKAEESDRLKTAFLQNTSHEIRTPLNAIMGFSELLSDHFDDKERLDEFTSIIRQRGADLLEIINGILDFAKIESGQVDIHLEECNLKDFCRELNIYFAELQARSGKQHIVLKMNFDIDQLNGPVLIDRSKLKQILTNLIANAFKFTNAGSIEIGCKMQKKNTLDFYVADTGIGIPASKHKSIFDRFIQATNETTRLYGGTGLGLSIVKGLLEILGGTIDLKSEPGKGSTFYFTIPYQDIPPTGIKAGNEPSTQALKNFGGKILIVEDDPFNTKYLQEILSATGAEVLLADNGQKAIDMVNDSDINVVFMDIRLPDIDGYEATQSIKKRNPDVKIIAQTAFATLADKQKALDAGCDGYLSKPILRSKLLETLDQVTKGDV